MNNIEQQKDVVKVYQTIDGELVLNKQYEDYAKGFENCYLGELDISTIKKQWEYLAEARGYQKGLAVAEDRELKRSVMFDTKGDL